MYSFQFSEDSPKRHLVAHTLKKHWQYTKSNHSCSKMLMFTHHRQKYTNLDFFFVFCCYSKICQTNHFTVTAAPNRMLMDLTLVKLKDIQIEAILIKWLENV